MATTWVPTIREESFPDRLKMVRIGAGLNQKQMAEKLEVPRASYATWEGGSVPRDPDLLTLVTLLVEKFNVCRDWLAWGTCEHTEHEEFPLRG